MHGPVLGGVHGVGRAVGGGGGWRVALEFERERTRVNRERERIRVNRERITRLWCVVRGMGAG